MILLYLAILYVVFTFVFWDFCWYIDNFGARLYFVILSIPIGAIIQDKSKKK